MYKLSNIERSRALMILKHGVPVIHMAAELHVSRQAIFKCIRPKTGISKASSGTTPPRKVGTNYNFYNRSL